MVELLGEVDTTGSHLLRPMADRKTVLRPDVAEEGTDRDHCLKPYLKENYYIKVPAILDDGGCLMTLITKLLKTCTTSLF